MWWVLWVIVVVPFDTVEGVKRITYPLASYSTEAECRADKEMMKALAVDLSIYSCERYGDV